MLRIVEKPEFMKVRLVTVCAKAEIGRKVRHKKSLVSCKSSRKLHQKGKFLTVQGGFCRIIDVVE